MERLKDIRKKIKSIKRTRRVVRTLEMVALNQLHRGQKKLEGSKIYSNELGEILYILTEISKNGISHPFFKINSYETEHYKNNYYKFNNFKTNKSKSSRDENNVLILILTSDRGLCGNYNILIMDVLSRLLKELKDKKIKYLVVGKKGSALLKETVLKEYEVDIPKYILKEYFNISENPTFEHAENVTNDIEETFLKKEIDSVYIIYTKFISVLYVKPVFFKILPLNIELVSKIFAEFNNEEKDFKSEHFRFIFEPSVQEIFLDLIHRYLVSKIYEALVESSLSENVFRHLAMGKASSNAEEIINSLIRKYNRIRQLNITKELEDIIKTSEALKEAGY